MTPDESHVYQRIICEQFTLQELQQHEPTFNGDPLELSRRIEHRRSVLSNLWATAQDLGRLKPLV